MYTAASATHIRAVVKDDTLGLGAGPRDALGEPTGLGAFTGLLGRLNGKTDTELEEDQRRRSDNRLARYAATKWQAVTFISGGLLTQEKSESHPAKPSQNNSRDTPEMEKTSGTNDHEGSDSRIASVKRLSSTGDTQTTHKSSKKRKTKSTYSEPSSEDGSKSEGKREKKPKKRKHTKEDSRHTTLDKHDTSQVGLRNGSSKRKDLPLSSVGVASKERRPMGRHTFRGRHMEAKKKALLDDKSLSEVFCPSIS